MIPSAQPILKKRDELTNLEQRLSAMIPQVQPSRHKALPMFDQYGWNRFGEFVSRLRDAIDDPVVEQVRQILAANRIVIAPNLIREGINEGVGLYDVANGVGSNLGSLTDNSTRDAAVKDIEKLMRSLSWDEAAKKAKAWKEAAQDLREALAGAPKAAQEFFTKALAESGPGSDVASKYRAMHQKALAIGGESLWTGLANETFETIQDLDDLLELTADLKNQLESVSGAKYTIPLPPHQQATGRKVAEHLKEKLDEARKQLADETQSILVFEVRVSNLTTLLGEDSEPRIDVSSIEAARQRKQYLDERLNQLTQMVKEILTPDAVELSESFVMGQIPSAWDDRRLAEALRSLLRGHRLTVEVKDAG